MKFFHDIRYRFNKQLPALKAVNIPIEVAIGILMLKMSPEDLVLDMKAEYWRGVKDGEPTVERLYTNWCSSKYACEAQSFVRGWWEQERSKSIDFICVYIC